MTTSHNYLPAREALEAGIGSLATADVVLLATHAIQAGNKSYALALCDAHPHADDPALRVLAAVALAGLGRVPPALELIDGVLADNPGHAPALFYGAQLALQTRQDPLATQLLLALLERCPEFPSAQGMLAAACFPGPPYRELLKRLHEILRPQSYLEIGVETGATLGFAKDAQCAVGIDPDASLLQRESLPPCARVFTTTSDAFFAENTRQAVFGDRQVDLALIDGMHLFEFALRDFIHVEAWSHPSSVVALHDCVPLSPLTASRERQSNLWVGDVWKVVSILREFRPDLSVKIIKTAPSGLCVVRGLDPSSRVLADQLDEIVARYRDVPYPGRGLDVPPGFELVEPNASGLRLALEGR